MYRHRERKSQVPDAFWCVYIIYGMHTMHTKYVWIVRLEERRGETGEGEKREKRGRGEGKTVAAPVSPPVALFLSSV